MDLIITIEGMANTIFFAIANPQTTCITEEYPNATHFSTRREALRIAKLAKGTYPKCTVNIIRDYGMNNQSIETVR